MSKKEIIKRFELFFGGTGGFDSWITNDAPDLLFSRLSDIKNSPLSLTQLNQLLLLSHESGATSGFFQYYWLTKPKNHAYDVAKVTDYNEAWLRARNKIITLDHLYWGIYRFYIDALLFFGNIRTAYRKLRCLSNEELTEFFENHCYDTDALQNRGPSLPLKDIAKDDRYLISEMACKSYGEDYDGGTPVLKKALFEAYELAQKSGIKRVIIKDLIDGQYATSTFSEEKQQLLFSLDELVDEGIESKEQLEEKVEGIAKKFSDAREKALENTRLYLSMVDELDVYVATSMRNRNDFRKMANLSEKIFGDKCLEHLNLRYFDPTISAAQGHMDKGLIECLMVKCAKALVYCAGEKESYGKDAEAAMALSQGKPVIFLCDPGQREKFYKEVHPLSRLIDFETGVPVGAMVTSDPKLVSKLLHRIFENKMEYTLERQKNKSIQLRENITKSIVRFQTDDDLLRETFWNYYHNK